MDSAHVPTPMPLSLDSLNPAQREAVEHIHGPLLVVAGAGSGKTRVLTHRIANILDARDTEGRVLAYPENILAITFTNKAAAEMRERVEQLVGDRGRGMWVMTFHAACGRILRREASRLGYTSSFSIYDQGDQVRLVKQCIESLDLDPKRFPPAAVHHQISAAKNQLLTASEYRSRVSNVFEETVADIYDRYDERLFAANSMDFDDMILKVVRLLEEFPDARSHWQQAFRFILVDEYQDTNHAQYRLLRMLAEQHGNLCCVGDADQSIYSWRGADIRNITSFEDDFPDAQVVVLDINYRSTGHILEAANGVIANNQQRIPKNLTSVFGDGERVEVLEVEDEHAEARFIAGRVEWALSNGYSANDIAVFYRTNAQSRVIEDVLTRTGVHYQVIGGPRFYERAEVKDAIAYLSLLVNPADVIALQRVINTPKRGIGATTVSKLRVYAETHQESLWHAITNAHLLGDLSTGVLGKLESFVELIRELTDVATSSGGGVARIIEQVFDRSGLITALQAEDTIEAEGRIENLGELLNVAREYDMRTNGAQLGEFLQSISLQSDADTIQGGGGIVTLMTMHNAKGLEYPVVFIAGMEEGLFPHSRSIQEANIEEERRLAYVGITRARERLTLLHASSRSVFGRRNWNMPSRFLDELPEHAIVRTRREQSAWGTDGGYGSGSAWQRGQRRNQGSWEDSSARNQRWSSADGTAASGQSGLLLGGTSPARSSLPAARSVDEIPQLSVGDNVRHASFGEGVVLAVERGELVVVRFSESGEERRLMLAYAPLERLP